MCKEAFNEYENNLRIATEQNPDKTDNAHKTDKELKQLAMDATNHNWEIIKD